MSNVEAEPLDRVNLSKKLKQHLDHRFNEVDRRFDEMERILKHGTNKILRTLNEEELFNMATQADLDAALASEDAQLSSLASDLQTSLSDLAAAIEAGKAGPDLQAEVDAVNGHVSQLASLAASAVAADPNTPAPAPAPSPEPTPAPAPEPTPVTPSPEPAPDQPTPTPDQPTA